MSRVLLSAHFVCWSLAGRVKGSHQIGSKAYNLISYRFFIFYYSLLFLAAAAALQHRVRITIRCFDRLDSAEKKKKNHRGADGGFLFLFCCAFVNICTKITIRRISDSVLLSAL